jgi:hypothetical protein
VLFYYIFVSDCRNNTVDEIFLSQRSVPVISVKPDLLEVIRGLLIDIDSSLNATNLKCAFEGK